MSVRATAMDWPVAELLGLFVGGPAVLARLPGEMSRIAGIVTDSRRVGAGDVFVALQGERFDAHDFLPQVAAQGAAFAIVQRALPDLALPQLVVAETRAALATLARAWRARFHLPVIAVAGSNGKTTTKEMIAAILRAAFGEHMLATVGNLNNEIGVPQTLFGLRATHRAAVVEIGMNHPGEIARLAAMVQPTIALVNNAQREHQEFMASVAAVAEENGAVFEYLAADGVAVFPEGTAYDTVWSRQAGAARSLRFRLNGPDMSGRGDVTVAPIATPDVAGSGDAQSLRVAGPWGAVSIALNALGAHNALNAAAAAACAWAAGCPAFAIAQGLNVFRPVRGRMQKLRSASGLVVIDDTYNANPDSVLAAIDVLAQYAPACALVLGDMGEVGVQGGPFHAEIGHYARQCGLEKLFALGVLARESAAAFGAAAVHCDSAAELVAQVQTWLSKRSGAVLVKGSRFMKMETIVQALLAAPGDVQTGGAHAA
ncbi:MAG: UDP-N-acetylmuramoyl-tripeptide--D-alanyl-D-alanine ligase [Burkholderiaceae bacterium]|jgi:UDP-N-acetylmuramoyl-tripeptide--D-alanyl-D-alanine ligase